MKDNKQTIRIHQSKRGITLLDGFYLVRNTQTGKNIVISISNGVVYIHDVTRQMALPYLVHMDAIGQLDVFEALKMTESEKQKLKNKKNDN